MGDWADFAEREAEQEQCEQDERTGEAMSDTNLREIAEFWCRVDRQLAVVGVQTLLQSVRDEALAEGRKAGMEEADAQLAALQERCDKLTEALEGVIGQWPVIYPNLGEVREDVALMFTEAAEALAAAAPKEAPSEPDPD